MADEVEELVMELANDLEDKNVEELTNMLGQLLRLTVPKSKVFALIIADAGVEIGSTGVGYAATGKRADIALLLREMATRITNATEPEVH